MQKVRELEQEQERKYGRLKLSYDVNMKLNECAKWCCAFLYDEYHLVVRILRAHCFGPFINASIMSILLNQWFPSLRHSVIPSFLSSKLVGYSIHVQHQPMIAAEPHPRTQRTQHSR
jgi:hypothetical protein